MEFIKFLVIAIICFYAFKYIMRLLMPFALRKLTERLMRKAQQSQFNGGGGAYQYNPGNPFDQFQQGSAQQQQQRAQPTGKVRVDYVPQPEDEKRKGPQTAGEFIDFEEIK